MCSYITQHRKLCCSLILDKTATQSFLNKWWNHLSSVKDDKLKRVYFAVCDTDDHMQATRDPPPDLISPKDYDWILIKWLIVDDIYPNVTKSIHSDKDMDQFLILHQTTWSIKLSECWVVRLGGRFCPTKAFPYDVFLFKLTYTNGPCVPIIVTI